jgi:hypothetical protein
VKRFLTALFVLGGVAVALAAMLTAGLIINR